MEREKDFEDEAFDEERDLWAPQRHLSHTSFLLKAFEKDSVAEMRKHWGWSAKNPSDFSERFEFQIGSMDAQENVSLPQIAAAYGASQCFDWLASHGAMAARKGFEEEDEISAIWHFLAKNEASVTATESILARMQAMGASFDELALSDPWLADYPPGTAKRVAPMELACDAGNRALLLALARAGAKVPAAVARAAMEPGMSHECVAAIASASGMGPNRMDLGNGESPLGRALSSRNLHGLRAILKAGADPNLKSGTPAMRPIYRLLSTCPSELSQWSSQAEWAAHDFAVASMEILMAHGAEPTAADLACAKKLGKDHSLARLALVCKEAADLRRATREGEPNPAPKMRL